MNKLTKIMLWLILAAPLVYLAAAWNRIPATVPLKYDLNGDPLRYGPKSAMIAVLLTLIAVNIGLYFLLVNLHRIDPKKKYTKENVPKMRRLAFAVCIFLSAISCFIVYSSITTSPKINSKIIVVGVGLLFTVMGNYMYTIKQNYFAGIRLPWTLENEDNWKKTHQLAGKLWFAGGLLLALAGIFLPEKAIMAFTFSIIIILTVIPTIYSYRLYKKQPH